MGKDAALGLLVSAAGLIALAVGVLGAAGAIGAGSPNPRPASLSAPTPLGWPTPTPTPTPGPYLALGSFQFLDKSTGWLSASSCLDRRPGDRNKCKPGFYGTTDGGRTWTLLSYEAIGPFVMDGSGTGISAGGFCEYGPCKSEVFATQDGGRHWSRAYSSALWLTDLSMIDGEAWLLGNSCGYSDRGSCTRYLLKSIDGGLTWAQTHLPIDGSGVSISRPTKHDAWVVSSSYGAHGQPAEIIATHDDGQTWVPLLHPTGFVFEEEIFFRTAQEGWLLIGGQPGAGSQDKFLFGTTDGGKTWTHLSDRIGGRYLGALMFTSRQEGWMVSAYAGSGLEQTSDGGRTWTGTSIDANYGGQLGALQFTDPRHGWTVSEFYSAGHTGPLQALWATSDGGATWQKLPLPPPENP